MARAPNLLIGCVSDGRLKQSVLRVATEKSSEGQIKATRCGGGGGTISPRILR